MSEDTPNFLYPKIWSSWRKDLHWKPYRLLNCILKSYFIHQNIYLSVPTFNLSELFHLIKLLHLTENFRSHFNKLPFFRVVKSLLFEMCFSKLRQIIWDCLAATMEPRRKSLVKKKGRKFQRKFQIKNDESLFCFVLFCL